MLVAWACSICWPDRYRAEPALLINLTTEQMILVVAESSRERCVDELSRVPHVPLDFSDAYLDALSLDQLRHVLLAAMLQARRHEHQQQAQAHGRPAA